MSKFDRYLLSQLLAVFGFFSLVLVAVYWINRAVGLFDQLIGDGQSALVFLEFSMLTLPNVIRLVLPISAFVAAVYVANRLTQESELVVMQATGVSAFRIMRPVMYFGLIVAVMMLVLMHVLVPASRTSLAARTAEISQNVTARFLKDGQFTHPSPAITLYIREVAPTGELLDLFLQDDRKTGMGVTYTARKALFVRSDTGPKLVMLDGMIQTLQARDGRMAVTRFGDFTYDLAGLIQVTDVGARSVDELSTAELMRPTPELLQETGVSAARFASDLHNRFAQPLLATVAALIGFATLLLGAFSRFGLWRQILGATALLLVLQTVATSGTAASMGSTRAWAWVYAAPVLGAVVTVAMLWYSQRNRRVGRATA